MSVEFSGEITAIATAVLAVFAIVTAVFAILAFRKQSREVRDQASMLKVQSDQLKEQRTINQKQTEVLELQAGEFRASQQERKREAEERKRAQAEQVHIALQVVAKGRGGAPVIEATVVNAHERQQPIYNVKLYWFRGTEGCGTPNPELLGTVLNWARESFRREFPVGANPAECGAFLVFRDALGADWVKAADGAAVSADSEFLPDFVKTLIRRNGG